MLDVRCDHDASLEPAWLERSVECSNCEIVMPLQQQVIGTLRAQAVAAQAAIDGLARQPSPRG